MYDIIYQLFVKKRWSVMNTISLVFSNFPQAGEVVIFISIFKYLTHCYINKNHRLLSILQTHLHLSFYLPFCETDTVIILFFQMRKLRFNHFPRSS